MKSLVALIKREYLEHRGAFLYAPAVLLIILTVILVGSLLSNRYQMAYEVGAPSALKFFEIGFLGVSFLWGTYLLATLFFYYADAFSADRRNNAMLFWKSMPVSDLTTVLSKASIPILVLPLIAFVLTVVVQLVMLLLSSAVLATTGTEVGLLWAGMPFLEASGVHLLHIVGTHGLGWAPLYAWLLLVSAWARRAPILWAVLPPIAVGAVERIAFGTTRFADFLRDYFLGGPMEEGPSGPMTMDMLMPQSLGEFVSDPGLWLGLAVTALFLLAAVRLRRSRGPI